MDDKQYEATQRTLMILAMIVKDLDLEGFLARIEQAETLGPVLSPTLFMLAEGKMGDVRRLAEACKGFQDEVRRQVDGPHPRPLPRRERGDSHTPGSLDTSGQASPEGRGGTRNE